MRSPCRCSLLLFLPLILIGLPIYLVLLRIHERKDDPPHDKPPAELVQELAALEDHHVHNPFTAIGFVKPGLFRRLTLIGVLMGINYVTRHVFNRGNLAGVKTIHFARWIFLDDKRRVIFASNYDGSLESYMDDFIDKIAWGLNIVFSNGFGYPRANWLIKDGARDELAFKDYLRLHQVPTRVWFSAYGRLSCANAGNNERIRAGLRGELDDGDDPALGAGAVSTAPEMHDVQGLVARGYGNLPRGALHPPRHRRPRRRAGLARHGRGRRHACRRAPAGARGARRPDELRPRETRSRRGHRPPVLERVRRRDDRPAPQPESRRPRRQRAGALGLGRAAHAGGRRDAPPLRRGRGGPGRPGTGARGPAGPGASSARPIWTSASRSAFTTASPSR